MLKARNPLSNWKSWMYDEQWKTVTPVAQRNCTARKLVGILEKVEDEEDGMAKENHRE